MLIFIKTVGLFYMCLMCLKFTYYLVCDCQDDLNVGDDIDAFLETLEKQKGLPYQSPDNGASEHRPVLYVEHR